MLWRLVRAGNEAVDRHRDVQLQFAHRSSLWRHARRTAQRVRSHRASQELDEAGDNPVNAIVSVIMLPSDGMFRTSRWRVWVPKNSVAAESGCRVSFALTGRVSARGRPLAGDRALVSVL